MKTKLTHPSSPRSRHSRIGFTALLLLTAITGWAAPFGSAFTYQGRLNFSGSPALDGLYDFRFALHSDATIVSPVGSALTLNAVPVTNGLFTVPLDFLTTPFTSGEARWLQLEVRTNGVTALIALTPRQRITPTPQALYAGSATTAATAGSVAPGAVTSAALAPGSVGGAAIADGSITSADLSASLLNNTFWKLTGNNVVPGQFLGSTNNQPVEIRANNFRALRLEPRGAGSPPNLVGGYHQNIVNGGGSTIAGGGTSGAINQTDGDYGFIGAGIGARAADSAFVGAGAYNSALGAFSMVGSGIVNTNRGLYAAIVAGTNNSVGPGADSAFVGGGVGNRALGLYSTISGGSSNTASGTNSTISGGSFNVAGGQSSFASGNRAKANHQGSFVWADAQNADFASVANNQFLIRAAGNVGINKPNPATALDVNGAVTATSFSGSGAGLTSLTAANLTGPLADARLSANVALRAGGNTFTGDQVISGGNLSLSDANTSLIFPATVGPNTPMVHLFASGTQNADRMVLSHSPGYPNWGLQYQDPADQFNFLAGGSPVMTVALGTRKVGIGTATPATSLEIQGDTSAGPSLRLTGIGGFGSKVGMDLATYDPEALGVSSVPARIEASDNDWSASIDFQTKDPGNNGNNALVSRLFIQNDGNIGIGTTSPSTKLAVNGTVTANSDASEGFYVGGTAAGYALEDRVTGAAGRWVMFAANDTLAFWRGGNTQMSVDQSGNFTTAGSANVCALTIRGGCDLAEPFQMSGKDLPKGAVVVIDEANPGHLKLSESAYDTRVAGIISGANGVNPGISLHQEGMIEGGQNVALSGRVYVQADASSGAIKPGDLLTTSATPGHAMKVAEHGKAQGAILGKAMTGLKEGQGMVLVLVSLQ